MKTCVNCKQHNVHGFCDLKKDLEVNNARTHCCDKWEPVEQEKKCQPCSDIGRDTVAVVMAPQSADQGKTINYIPICEYHWRHWWDGADWDGRQMVKPIDEKKQS